MIKLDDVTENAIIFQSVLRNGVPTIPTKLYSLVERVCKKYNLSVKEITGNFKVICFKLNQYISEEQAIDISNWITHNNK
jgi:hypothetical protein